MSAYDWADALRISRMRNEVKKAQELNEKKLYKIRQYKQTRVIVYPEMKEAFEYVDKLYPSSMVKEATVYYTSKAVLNEVGYRGVGGFYDCRSKLVVISNWVAADEMFEDQIQAEFTPDEVLCHELIHYAANYHSPVSCRNVEEEIAYGKSINYLRFKGRSDNFIINKNMMPYLVSVVDKQKLMMNVLQAAYPDQLPDIAAISNETKELLIRQLGKQLEKAIRVEAALIGQRMITLYGDHKDIVDNIIEAPERNLIMDDD